MRGPQDESEEKHIYGGVYLAGAAFLCLVVTATNLEPAVAVIYLMVAGVNMGVGWERLRRDDEDDVVRLRDVFTNEGESA